MQAGYSVLGQLPKIAPSWIDMATSVIRSQVKLCILSPVGDEQVRLGKPGTRLDVEKSSYERVVSPTLGEYPIEYTHNYNARRTSIRLKTLLTKMKKYHTDKVKVYTKPGLCDLLHTYTRMSKADTVFPFADNSVFGLSVESMHEAVAVLPQSYSCSDSCSDD